MRATLEYNMAKERDSFLKAAHAPEMYACIAWCYNYILNEPFDEDTRTAILDEMSKTISKID